LLWTAGVQFFRRKKLRVEEEIVILAGGFGTRLRSVLGDIPKPLAPVQGKPFLYYLLEQLRVQGVRRVILSLHHMADQLVKFGHDYAREHAIILRYVIEPRPLGTGGALRYAIRECGIEGPIFACNGDTYLTGGIAELRAADPPARHFTIGLVEVVNTERYGAVQYEPALGRISSFSEKTASAGRGSINCGLYRFQSTEISSINRDEFSLERDVFPELLATRRLYGCLLAGEFMDIGVPGDYERFIRDRGNTNGLRGGPNANS